jgi:hypothetical protein
VGVAMTKFVDLDAKPINVSDSKLKKNGEPKRIGGTALIAKKVGISGTPEIYENTLRFEGAIAVVERFSDKLNTVIEKLDKLESNKQQLEGYIEVEQESKHLVIHINMDDKS